MKAIIETLLTRFETKTRNNGSSYMVFDSHNQHEQDFIATAHGQDMLPDDFRYATIKHILDRLMEYDFEIGDFDDQHVIVDSLVDIYNHYLLQWLASNLNRAEYVNEAVANGMVMEENFGLYRALMAAQYLEIDQIFSQVVNALNEFKG
jgi:hypothetical protein